MVRGAAERIAKYNSKYDPAIVASRFTAVEGAAKAGFETAVISIAQMEDSVQTILNTDDILPLDRPKYYNLSREVWKLINNGVADPALTTIVCTMLVPKYETLGCLAPTVASILLNVFSITCAT